MNLAPNTSIVLLVSSIMNLGGTSVAHAQQGEDLREAAQNPIADLISLPFQNNTNFDIDHTDNTQNVLNIQPVYPTHLSPNWNLITRPILPVISQPPFLSGPELHAAEQVFGPEIGETEFGLGDLTPEFFFSPRKPIQLGPEASLVWGLGPAFQFPTATDDELGTGKWSAGPGFVVFLSDRALHVTTGFLILNLWSFAGDEDRADVNAMTLQPFLNYNLPKGWYLTTSPLITANWEADDDNRWTVPIGGGIGRIFKIGHQKRSLTPVILFAASPGTITGVITLAVVHTKLLRPVTALVAVAVATVVMWIMMVLVGREGTHAGNGFLRDTATRFMGLIIIAMGTLFALTGLHDFFIARRY